MDMSTEAFEGQSQKTKSEKPKELTANPVPLPWRAACGLLAFGFSAFSGCNEPPAVNPWLDDSIPQQTWGTPSGESVLVAHAQPTIRQRGFPPSTAPAVDESVPHYPLWFEDPYEEQGDRDGVF